MVSGNSAAAIEGFVSGPLIWIRRSLCRTSTHVMPRFTCIAWRLLCEAAEHR